MTVNLIDLVWVFHPVSPNSSRYPAAYVENQHQRFQKLYKKSSSYITFLFMCCMNFVRSKKRTFPLLSWGMPKRDISILRILLSYFLVPLIYFPFKFFLYVTETSEGLVSCCTRSFQKKLPNFNYGWGLKYAIVPFVIIKVRRLCFHSLKMSRNILTRLGLSQSTQNICKEGKTGSSHTIVFY